MWHSSIYFLYYCLYVAQIDNEKKPRCEDTKNAVWRRVCGTSDCVVCMHTIFTNCLVLYKTETSLKTSLEQACAAFLRIWAYK